jgi:hypothetical protein
MKVQESTKAKGNIGLAKAISFFAKLGRSIRAVWDKAHRLKELCFRRNRS